MTKYSGTELQLTLDSKVILPEGISELDFHHQIQANKNIRWEVNPFVLDEDCLSMLLDEPNYNRWRVMPKVGQLIGTFITYWCLRTWTAEMLLLLFVLPFTIVALPHLLFITCMGVVIGVKLYFNLVIPLFWVIIPLAALSFMLTKSTEELAERLIIKQGLRNWETFWMYYSNQIIYPVWTHNIEEAKYLLERYPELAVWKEKVAE